MRVFHLKVVIKLEFLKSLFLFLTLSSIFYIPLTQCDQIWRKFTTLAKFKEADTFRYLYLALGKILNLLWQIIYAIEQIFHWCKWPDKKIILASDHTDLLPLSYSLSLSLLRQYLLFSLSFIHSGPGYRYRNSKPSLSR